MLKSKLFVMFFLMQKIEKKLALDFIIILI
jgi:hypothetical protein